MRHTSCVIPIRLIETDREGFDRPVVELWRDDEFVGMVFWDGETTVVQIYPTGGDVHDLELRDLQRALDAAERIVDFEAFDVEMADDIVELKSWEDEAPTTLRLVGEFDSQATYRSKSGEGFFPKLVADELIKRCEELDLAVIEMEGFSWDGDEPVPIPPLDLAIRREPVMEWSTFRTYANARAGETLVSWPDEALVAFELQPEDGDTFVA